MNVWAIIPARSGSTRFKDKNIKNFLETKLFIHSVLFAKKLNFVSKIVFSTDSEKYSSILNKNIENIHVHKRKEFSSKNNSMEDIRKNFSIDNSLPDVVVWLRPTHPLRCVETFQRAFKKFKKYKCSVAITHTHDPRLFYEKNKKLYPMQKKFNARSMIRMQGLKALHSIFSGEIFKFPKKFDKKFLGQKIYFEVAPKFTNYDIDNEQDLTILNKLVKSNKSLFKKYIHDKIK